MLDELSQSGPGECLVIGLVVLFVVCHRCALCVCRIGDWREALIYMRWAQETRQVAKWESCS